MLKETLIDAGILCEGQQYATLCGAASVSSRHDRSNFQPCSTERSLIPGVTNGGAASTFNGYCKVSRAVQGARAPAPVAQHGTHAISLIFSQVHCALTKNALLSKVCALTRKVKSNF